MPPPYFISVAGNDEAIGKTSETLTTDRNQRLQEQTGAHGQKTFSIAKDSLERIHFTFDEAFALMQLRPHLDTYCGTLLGEAAASAYEKIQLAIGPRETRYLDKMLPRHHASRIGSDYSKKSDVILALTCGIEGSKATFISYQSSGSTEPVTYDIHPYGMAEHRGTLYVVGHSCHHNEIRTWKVDRVIVVLDHWLKHQQKSAPARSNLVSILVVLDDCLKRAITLMRFMSLCVFQSLLCWMIA